MANPRIPDIATLIQMGINPKTGLPMKFGNKRCDTKQDIKRAIRKNDEQIFVNRYTWYNLPCDISSQYLERLLYYKGQLAFFYSKEFKQFYFMTYAMDGDGPDFYGRYQTIHPIPISGSKSQTAYLSNKKLNCVYGMKTPEDLTIKDMTDSAVLLHDYTKQLGEEIIPTQIINDSIIDLEAECMPYLRTALLLGTGIKGVRVPEGAESSIRDANNSMVDAAEHGEAYVPIVGNVEFQELTDGTARNAQDFLLAMQSIDNFRLGLHGVDNGGLFEKKSYVNNAQTGLNTAGGDVGLTLQDGLSIRQAFCNIVNSIWGLGIWCEISENLINADLDGDGVAYERNENGENGGVEDGNSNINS